MVKQIQYKLCVVLVILCSSCTIHRPAYLKEVHPPYMSGKLNGYSCNFLWSIDIPITKNVCFNESGAKLTGIQYTYNDSSIIYITTEKESVNYSHIISSISTIDSLRRFRPIFLEAIPPFKDTLDYRGVDDNIGIVWRDRTIRIYSSYFSVGYVVKDSARTKQFDDYIESLKLEYIVPRQEHIDNEIRAIKERGGDSAFYKLLEEKIHPKELLDN